MFSKSSRFCCIPRSPTICSKSSLIRLWSEVMRSSASMVYAVALQIPCGGLKPVLELDPARKVFGAAMLVQPEHRADHVASAPLVMLLARLLELRNDARAE